MYTIRYNKVTKSTHLILQHTVHEKSTLTCTHTHIRGSTMAFTLHCISHWQVSDIPDVAFITWDSSSDALARVPVENDWSAKEPEHTLVL